MELLIVKGWANKDVAEHLDITEQAVASYNAGISDNRPAQGDGPPRRKLTLDELGGG